MQKQANKIAPMLKRTPIYAAMATCIALAGCSATQSPTEIVTPHNHLDTSAVLGLKTSHTLIKSGEDAATRKTIGDKVRVQQPSALPGPVVSKVILTPVNVSREFESRPYDPARVEVGQSIPENVPDNLSRWVQVSGDYTPKGVYSRPNYTSRILTRVAPGTRLRLADDFDGWLKVETGQGIGYLRSGDAKQLARISSSS